MFREDEEFGDHGAGAGSKKDVRLDTGALDIAHYRSTGALLTAAFVGTPEKESREARPFVGPVGPHEAPELVARGVGERAVQCQKARGDADQ